MYKIQNHKVSENPLYRTHLDRDGYERMYRQSIEQPDMFWAEQANRFVEWMQPWSKVHESNMEKGEAAWFIDAKLNVSVNCIDRHLKKRADQTAIIWEGDDPADSRHITYRQLHEEVCRLANVLKQRGVSKGDRVCIYMPMIPEAAFAMLAGVAPIPANSGQVTTRHRLNRYGDRALNRALHTIVLSRVRYDENTRAYVTRRTTEGKTPREIKRCLKRYVARDIYRLLEHQSDQATA